MRILIRHLNPGDQITICGQPQTVSATAHDGDKVHLHVVGDPYSPYVFPDSDLITVTAFAA